MCCLAQHGCLSGDGAYLVGAMCLAGLCNDPGPSVFPGQVLQLAYCGACIVTGIIMQNGGSTLSQHVPVHTCMDACMSTYPTALNGSCPVECNGCYLCRKVGLFTTYIYVSDPALKVSCEGFPIDCLAYATKISL
jgi:hypothetical protein